MNFQLMGLWQCMCKSTCTKARVEGREAPQEHADMYVWLGNFSKLFTQAPVVQTQQNLFLVFIWQVLCLFRNHAIYLCHRESVSWQNGSVVSSADALEFESLSTQIILDWIVLHTNENTESMVKGRINPISVIMWRMMLTRYSLLLHFICKFYTLHAHVC